MAEGAVGFVLNQIGTLLLQEGRLLSGIQSEVEDIKIQFESMQAFLKDADSREEENGAIKTWVKQVREVAYDTEDALDEFMLLSARKLHPSNLFIRYLCKTTYFVKYCKVRRRIANQIKSIKTRVHNIKERCQTYQFGLDHQASSSTYKPDPRGDDALLVSESELVGIDESRDEMLRLLLDEDPKLKVISVVGMAGLGKTTLVKKVYDFQRVKDFFHCHAWIIVSQSFQIDQILRDLIKQLFGDMKLPTPEGVETMNRVHLNEVLTNFLQQKRYVIVFDDIWSTDAWDALNYALPRGDNHSRIVITTRNVEVASYISRSLEGGNIYEPRPLNEKEAWDLFCRKAFRSSDYICPSGLRLIAENILSKCEGLPLAIVVISSLLSTRDNIEEWQRVLHSLHPIELNNITKIIMLSYSDLPFDMKSCLLYLSIFPEDYQFNRTKLVRIWVAEGFVEDKHGSKAEDVAENYFNELVNRNFIQAVAKYVYQPYKVRWQVHDLIREIILQKSQNQNFATVLEEEEQSMRVGSRKIRRLSIHKSNERLQISCNESKSFSNLWSLFWFDKSSMPTFSWGAFKLLKVLDLEGAPLEVFPQQIVGLFHLKFLSLKSTKIKTIPSSIGMLLNLETLDLRYTSLSKLPNGILKLRRLRHLLACKKVGIDGFAVPNGIGNLESLQTLVRIQVNPGTNIARELGRLTQLRKLGITKLRREDGINLCASIEQMKNLRCLWISAVEHDEIIDMEFLTCVSPFLRKLKIWGRLDKLPRWIPSLDNLERVILSFSSLSIDPLESLQALPRLVELQLFHNAYVGQQLCFPAGGFPRLLYLYIGGFTNLRRVMVDEGAMPLVRTISICKCEMLERVPIGIEGLKNLKELNFMGVALELVNALHPERGQDLPRIQHIPHVSVEYSRGEEEWECWHLKEGEWVFLWKRDSSLNIIPGSRYCCRPVFGGPQILAQAEDPSTSREIGHLDQVNAV